jgi:hypothetical protein
VQKRFDTPGHVQLRVSIPAGSVRIEEGEPGATEIDLAVSRGDESALDDVIVESREIPGGGHEIRVEHTVKGFFLKLGRSPEFVLALRVPPSADLECSTASADVVARGLLGAVNVKTASGDLSFDRVGAFRAHSASGDVFVGEAFDRAQANTASGDVRFGAAHGEAQINTVSGDVTIADARGSVTLQTVSGDQRAEGVERGEARCQSVSGDVRIGVKRGVAAFIDASSVSGSLRSELDMEDEPAGDEPVLHVKARTVSGDIDLVRSTVPTAVG